MPLGLVRLFILSLTLIISIIFASARMRQERSSWRRLPWWPMEAELQVGKLALVLVKVILNLLLIVADGENGLREFIDLVRGRFRGFDFIV